MSGPRVVEADNAGPFTLGGTRSHVLGRSVVAVIDPGPDHPAHLDRLAEEVADAERGTILLTHHHADHSAGADGLAARTGFHVAGPSPARSRTPPGRLDRALRPGERVVVDGGWLEAIDTPGHARRHLAYLEHPGRALFVGDLLLGKGKTTWVGAYSGCVSEYLASLDRVEALEPTRLFPAHGPPLERPREAVQAFRAHRRERIDQVARAAEEMEARRALRGGTPLEEIVSGLLERVYPEGLVPKAREGAYWSLCAILEHLDIAAFPGDGPEEG